MKIYNILDEIFFFLMMASLFSSRWPDPNSPVLSKIDFGVPVVDLLLWLDVRDALLGENERKQDVSAALALARGCKHPDALWLTSVCKDVTTKEEARAVFLSFETDARALCFAWFLSQSRSENLLLLRRAAEMGCALACSRLSFEIWYENEQEAFRWANFSAGNHERDGCNLLGCCLRDGHGAGKDEMVSKKMFLIAAELGYAYAAEHVGAFLEKHDRLSWLWLERAAVRGLPYSFLGYFSKHYEMLFSQDGNASVLFVIGRALKGKIDVEKKEVFGVCYNFDSYIGPVNQAVSFYEYQIKSARLAVDAWTHVSTRLHLIKDMRIFIGKMIWEARFEANYNKSSSVFQELTSIATFREELETQASLKDLL